MNNELTSRKYQKAMGLEGVLFENEYRFTKRQLAQFFEVSERTIENYIEKNHVELAKNGYGVLKGKQLIDFKLIVDQLHVHEMDFMNKTVRLGVFNFRTMLNLGNVIRRC